MARDSDIGPFALIAIGALSLAVSAGIVIAVNHRKQIRLAIALAEMMHGKFPNVPRSLILAVIAKESTFDPNALNDKGGDAQRGNAWGLMQVTLQTSRDLGFNGEPQELLQPDINVYYGTKELSKLIGAYHDIDLAVAAYNRGPGNVDKLLAKGIDVRSLPYVTVVRANQSAIEEENQS